MHGSRRNGPFRDINDFDYLNFQKKLLIQNKNIIIKRHPKERRYLKRRAIIKFKHKIIYDMQKNSEAEFRYVIVDRISQKFFESIIFKRPVLYLDMNVRNLNPKKKTLLKKNMFINKVNIYKPKKIILDKKLVIEIFIKIIIKYYLNVVLMKIEI